MTSRSPERKELARRIDAVAVLASQLEEAHTAEEKAVEGQRRALACLESLKAEAEKPSNNAALMAKIAAGEDVAALAKTETDLSARITEANREWQAWANVREKAGEAIKTWQQALDLARLKLDDAIAAVIAGEAAIPFLIEEAERLAQPFLATRARLRALSGSLPPDAEARNEIESFLNRPIDLLLSDDTDAWKRQPFAAAVHKWREELRTNPDALPEEQD
jgi:DNA repair exonuclease SbcCD ATPase subunit